MLLTRLLVKIFVFIHKHKLPYRMIEVKATIFYRVCHTKPRFKIYFFVKMSMTRLLDYTSTSTYVKTMDVCKHKFHNFSISLKSSPPPCYHFLKLHTHKHIVVYTEVITINHTRTEKEQYCLVFYIPQSAYTTIQYPLYTWGI